MTLKNLRKTTNKAKITSGIGVFLTSLLTTLAVVLLLYGLGSRLLPMFRDSAREGFSAETEEEMPSPKEHLVASSFTDLFSGTGWIDEAQTNLYLDRSVTAFTFPPEFSWKKLSVGSSIEIEFIKKQGDGSDIRCLERYCLVENDSRLFFAPKSRAGNYNSGSYRLSLPSEIDNRRLVNVSIGVLDTKWLVGAVEKINGEYLGRVYYFNGSDFEKIINDDMPFRSEYKGIIGFGGVDNNFLVLYGAYEGQAYHVRSGMPPNDISSFFGIKVMGKGFHPVVLKSGEGESGTWFIYSTTEENPKLIKLFQDKAGRIRGALDLSDLVFSKKFIDNVENAHFAFGDAPGQLYAEVIDSAGNRTVWEFTDKGFRKTTTFQIVSSNINNYTASVRQVNLSELDLSSAGARIDLLVSNDGEKWHKVEPGEDFVFPNKDGRELLWRAFFVPDERSAISPFFARLRLDYLVKFL